MRADSFDKEISQLYQQRKREITAPNINVNDCPKSFKNDMSLTRLLMICFAGGVASFGVFAVINYLANKPQITSKTFSTNHIIEIKEPPAVEITEKAIVVKQILPSKPIAAALAQVPTSSYQKQQVANKLKLIDLKQAKIQQVSVPKIEEPKIVLKPIYKVMPKYSAKAMQANEAGEIKLRYQINPQGKVEGIEVITSSVGRILKKSAIQALEQWQYQSNDNYQKSYEIIFAFNANK